MIHKVNITNNSFNPQTLDTVADALIQTGYIVLKDVLENNLLISLQQRLQQIPAQQWQQAGIGRKQDCQVNTDIRSDEIYWMTRNNEVEAKFLDCMEALRSGINRRLYLGLFDYESHFAIYPKGSFYQKHIDALKGKSNRVLSTVLYLNDNWQANYGGELLIYKDSYSEAVHTISPQLGTLVIFLSEAIVHEVVKANRERHSIAGWFRVNNSHTNQIDPCL